jgi:CubicO group peptidase (beta-lactamase class C family)
MLPGMRIRAAIALAAVAAAACGGGGGTPPIRDPKPDDAPPPARTKTYKAEVDALVKPLIGGEWMAGVSIGLIHGDDVHYYGYGRARDGDATPPNADTLFEIGSVTKVFTALLLADAVARLVLDFADPVSKHLPEGRTLAAHAGGAITIEQLATHSSGLPRMPDNFHPKDPANPYADYTADDLYGFLANHEPARAPGAGYEYSNLATALLGEIVTRLEARSFETLVVERVAAPLRLDRTLVAIREGDANVASGHDGEGKPAAHWDFDVFAAAGALRSTTRDMVAFVRANMAADHELLGPAMKLAREPRFDAGDVGKVGLGWHIKGDGTCWHNGQTGGFHSFIAFDEKRDIGVVVLTNSGTGLGDVLGEALLLMLAGEPYAIELPTTVKLSEEVLARYVGTYKLSAELVISISRVDDRLYAQATGWPGFRLYASSETEFYLRVADAQIQFEVGDRGAVKGLVLRQGGQEFRGPRL